MQYYIFLLIIYIKKISYLIIELYHNKNISPKLDIFDKVVIIIAMWYNVFVNKNCCTLKEVKMDYLLMDCIQQELVQLLSMFEVSFSAKQRKNYLFYCLVHLFDDRNINDYLLFVQGLAKKYFYNVYLNKDCLTERNQPAPNAFDNAIIQDGNLNVNSVTIGNSEIFENIYRQGSSNIPLFVFNYTDYRLWKMYAEVLKGNKTRKDDASRKLFFGKYYWCDKIAQV